MFQAFRAFNLSTEEGCHVFTGVLWERERIAWISHHAASSSPLNPKPKTLNPKPCRVYVGLGTPTESLQQGV